MADGTISLCSAIIVASDKLIAIERVHVIAISLPGAVVIIDIIYVLRCDSPRVSQNRYIIGKNYIDMDVRACDRMRDQEGDQGTKETDGIHCASWIKTYDSDSLEFCKEGGGKT